VFSGVREHYCETDSHDALDVYGKTKSLGEAYGESVHHLRCSIIGPEPKEHKFLLDWFLGQPEGSTVNGFTNHLWNGVTTLQFAKICAGVIRENLELPHVQHVVPQGEITKYEMLRSLAFAFGRDDICVSEAEARTQVNRTLATTAEERNRQLWVSAGYTRAPTVPEMIGELSGYDMGLTSLT